MADWIAFLVLSALAIKFAVGAILGGFCGAALTGDRRYWLAALLPGAISALLFWAAFRIAPFSMVITS